MRRRQFQEVALSLSAPGTFLPTSTATSTPGPAPTLVRVRALHPRTPSPAKSPTVSETDTADPESYPITPPSPPSRARSGASIMKKEGSLLGRLVSATASLRGGTEKAQDAPTPQRTPPAPRREVQSSSVQEGGGLEQRVDGWITGLRAATALDAREAYQEALLAYSRLNRQITRDSIYEYEQLNCDQKKLLNQVLTCLDQRTHLLRAKLRGLDKTLTVEKSGAEVDGLAEIEGCVEVLETIKRMRGKGKVRVVLVYRERRHRTHHRHQDKGQSNKVVFAKEKRDFLSLLGLPGAMISERGLDFSVRPNTATAEHRMAATAQSAREKQEEGELEPDEKNGGGAVATEGGSGEECEAGGSPRRARQLLNRVVPFMKRGSVSPQRQGTPSSNRSASTEPQSDQEATGSMCDARSTLSCDSCSSDESSETEDETDIVTDTAVPGTYIHRESLNPASLAHDGLHITLELDKLGLKKTTRLVSPFLRVSVRDSGGGIAWGSSVQETGQWEVVNRHYLRADTRVHIQPALDNLPNDVAIFLELRHHRPDRGVLSTICYTFLERQDLSSGAFICELYSPPVDYTRKVLHTYTEKAFFLHLSVKLHQGGEDNQEEEEQVESGRASREGSVGLGDNRSKTSQHSLTPS